MPHRGEVFRCSDLMGNGRAWFPGITHPSERGGWVRSPLLTTTVGVGRGPKVGRGDVRAAILTLLAEGPMHGYQVIQEVTERSEGVWRPSRGSIYPTLQLLEDQGLVRSEEIDGRRVFHLTEAGKAEAEKRGKEAPAPWEVSADAGPLMDLREVGFGVVAAVMQVAHTGNERQIAGAQEIVADARRKLYLLLGEDEPTNKGDQ